MNSFRPVKSFFALFVAVHHHNIPLPPLQKKKDAALLNLDKYTIKQRSVPSLPFASLSLSLSLSLCSLCAFTISELLLMTQKG
jgi:hypothetical protein